MAAAGAERLVTNITPVNQRIMGLRISHTRGFISLVSVYTPTGVSEFSVKEAFYAPAPGRDGLESSRDTLIILGDFNAITKLKGVALCQNVFVYTALDQEIMLLYVPAIISWMWNHPYSASFQICDYEYSSLTYKRRSFDLVQWEFKVTVHSWWTPGYGDT